MPLPRSAPSAGAQVGHGHADLRRAATRMGFDAGPGAATRFDVFTQRPRHRVVASMSVPAGRGDHLRHPRRRRCRAGINLAWRPTARPAAGAPASSATPRSACRAVACAAHGDRYAKAVVDLVLPACRRHEQSTTTRTRCWARPNAAALGPKDDVHRVPEPGREGLRHRGHGGLRRERPGPDVRVYQAVGSEPVTLYAAGTPNGPFILLGDRVPCGNRVPGGSQSNRYCDFDLADGRDRPRPATSRSRTASTIPALARVRSREGADIDAVQILNLAAP